MRKVCLPVLLLAAITVPAAGTPGTPSIEGPDVPAVTPPAATLTVFEDESFFCTGSPVTKTIAVPDGDWDRIILVFSSRPDGDPWDRSFGVAIGGVEVVRGTTPRAPFTVRKDITEFAALLPPGGTADVSLLLSTYVGKLLGSVRLEFYADEPTGALVRRPAGAVLGAFAWRGLGGNGSKQSAAMSFPATAPASATVELTLSGHGDEEFWFTGSYKLPRTFHVLVGGTEVATVKTVPPYVYAFLGFGGPDPYKTCDGPQTDGTGNTLHPLMWWTAQQALDAAGIHTGVGEIPPYRAEVLESAALALLSGERTVEVVQEAGKGTWTTSLSFMLR